MTAPIGQLRLVLLEDDAEDAAIVRRLLQGSGWDLIWTRSPNETAAALAGGADALLLDYHLGAGSGLDVMRRLRAGGDLTPVLLLTGADPATLEEEALAAGVHELLEKNRLDARTLRRAIRYAVERGRAEAELARTQRLLQGALDAIPAHLAVVGDDGIILAVNAAWRRFAAENGYGDPDAGLGVDYLAVSEGATGPAADEAHAVARGIREVLSGASDIFTVEYPCHAPGIERWFDVRVTRFGDGHRVRALVAHDEVTGRRRRSERLRQRERELATLAENSPDVIARIDTASRLTYLNPAGARLTQRPADTLVGRTLDDLFASGDLPPAWRPRITEILGSRTSRAAAYEVVTPDGRRWLHVTATPEWRADGTVESVLCIARDVTEQRMLEEQLVQSQKMEAVGQLAGGIAHDFNNLLTAILSNTELALLEIGAGTAAQEIEEIRRTAFRAADLTRQLLAFSRRQILQPEVLRPADVLVDAERLLRRVLTEDRVLTLQLAPDTGRVRADRAQLEQVILNLVINARDATRPGGRIGIVTADVTVTGAEARRRPGLKPGRYVRLVVRDDGCGMTPEVAARVFEPFFTTKETGRGTGLGLATVYGIVKQSGGYIGIETASGSGSCFEVYLPRYDGPAVRAAPDVSRQPAERGRGSLLVVEDDPAVRAALVRVLARNGYNVREADNGVQALELCRIDGPFDLVLSDLVMPEMGGRMLIDHLRTEFPELPILLMSGYDQDAEINERELPAGVAYLPKPFAVDQLLARLAALRATGAPDGPEIRPEAAIPRAS